MKKILLTLGLSLACMLAFQPYLKAQCSFTATAATTESRCRESGTITITPSTKDSYTYQIIAGPVTTLPSSSAIFNGLPAGDYTVAVSFDGCTQNIPAKINGNYLEPGVLTASAKNITCPGESGCITMNQPTNGRLPYTYLITGGPETRPIQTSPVFCNLPAGTYSLQALDSCGVIRTSLYTITTDTSDFYAYTYGYNISFANCNDMIVCPEAGFSNTTLYNRLMKVWYINPAGDTLKVNDFEYPVKCDTLVGQSHSYGTWKIIAFDTCGRTRQSTFTFYSPGIGYNINTDICNGYRLAIVNQWKYALPVGYRIKKCSDSSIVFDTIITPPSQFYSPYFELENDTCYLLEHFNNCGDTVRYPITRAKPIFYINASQGQDCKMIGMGRILLQPGYLTGKTPVTYRIIDGPDFIGLTVVQGVGMSIAYMDGLPLGTYSIEGVDACGWKDTVTITLDKPLQRSIEVTQTKNCSGGANVHVKIITNFVSAVYPAGGPGFHTYVTATSTGHFPVNVLITPPTATTPSVWEADYLSVNTGNMVLTTYAYDGCAYDTTVSIAGYSLPSVSSVIGYACENGTGAVNYTLTGGREPYSFRIRETGSPTWSAFQSNTIFTGISEGLYDLEVQDGCPNGSITSFAFTEWQKTPIVPNLYCTPIGETALLTTNPIIEGVTYEWLKNGTTLASGPTLTIANYQTSNNGTYWLKQTFPGGDCIDSSALVYLDCSVLNNSVSNLYGQKIGATSQLKWQANTSDKGILYKIERSMDGINFKIAGQVAAVNNASGYSYSFIDKNPLAINYYRLNIESVNGKISYSNSIRIDHKNFDVTIKASPNPFTDKLRVYIHAPIAAPGLIKIRSITGNAISSINENITKGNNVIVLDEKIKRLPVGMYLVEVYIGTEKHILKVIKH